VSMLKVFAITSFLNSFIIKRPRDKTVSVLG
jgi:hypothetical protein